MSVVEINSEARENVVETSPKLGPSNHCLVIMEPEPLATLHAVPPRWRVAVTLTLVDPVLGPDPLLADLPTVVVGPLIHKRQIAAVAKYPGNVTKWSFRFESDQGRATARVWLHPATAPHCECGIFPVHHSLK